MSAEPDPLNPYASPAVADAIEHSSMSREDALRRLRWPARGIIAFSVINIAWQALFFAFWLLLVLEIPGPAPPMTVNELLDQIVLSTLFVFVVVLQPIILLGLRQLLRGRLSRLSWVAAFAGLIPCASPCAWGSVPFAVWLLLLLCREDIQSALNSEE